MVKLSTKQEIKEALDMPFSEFQETITAEAIRLRKETTDNSLYTTAMLGYTNHCKNQCLYCGMRAGNTKLPRYRIPPCDIINSAKNAKEMGLERIFLIAGEDRGYKFDDILEAIKGIHDLGLQVSFAGGEFTDSQYNELENAGVHEYVLKFEMSHEDTFNRLNPSTNYTQRMAAIEKVKSTKMLLASGNIVDYPGQTQDELIDDIMLMKQLDISWAPVIPYMPAAGTPLAEEGGRGNLETSFRQISIIRNLLPNARYTAQHPGEDPKLGVSAEDGNLNALNSGADTLFVDLLPAAQAQNFSVIDNRIVLGFDHAKKMAALAGMNINVKKL